MAAFGLDSLSLQFAPGDGPMTASPTWVAITTDADAPLVVTRGRGSVHQTFDAGTMTSVLDNASGNYDPDNTAGTHSPNLNNGIPVRFRAEFNTITYPVFWGQMSKLTRLYVAGGGAWSQLEVTENLGILQTTRLTAEAYSAESTDTRIGNVLDTVGWPAGKRNLDAGAADVAAVTFSGSVRALINQTVEAEQGRLYVERNGDLALKNRVAYASATAAATFGPGGSELDYLGPLQPSSDDALLINLAEITGAVGDPQTSQDSASQTAHGEQSYTSTNASIIGEPDALNVAEWLTANYADPQTRAPEMRIAPQKDPTNLWPEVLGRELGDVIRIKHTPPAGDQINILVTVEGIQHELAGGLWLTTYRLSPLSALAGGALWELDTSQLDTTTVLA